VTGGQRIAPEAGNEHNQQVTRARRYSKFRPVMRWAPRTYPQVILLSLAYGTISLADSAFSTVPVLARALVPAGATVLSLAAGLVELRRRRDRLASGALGLSRSGADGDAAERWSREHPADFLSRAAAAVRVGGDQETVTRTDG
jgi:hypothetical protein